MHLSTENNGVGTTAKNEKANYGVGTTAKNEKVGYLHVPAIFIRFIG